MFDFFIQYRVLSIHSDVAVYGIKTEGLWNTFWKLGPLYYIQLACFHHKIQNIALVLILASTRPALFNYQFTILSVVEVL